MGRRCGLGGLGCGDAAAASAIGSRSDLEMHC